MTLFKFLLLLSIIDSYLISLRNIHEERPITPHDEAGYEVEVKNINTLLSRRT
jgi:hypothetical protein